MKAVLMSIQPKWCELIASGKKTVEVRKTKPKLDVPFKVYIYCTKDNTDLVPSRIWWKADKTGFQHILNGMVIGEFVCDTVYDILHKHEAETGADWWDCGYKAKEDGLSVEELEAYLTKGYGYGWHISNLVIYDEPRGLGEFIVPSKIGCCNEGKCRGCQYFDRGNGFNVEDDCNAKFSTDEYKPLRRPPQSWCYVEEVRDET